MKRLKCFPVKVVESANCREELIKILGEHIDNYLKKDEIKYKGTISLIKVGEDVGNETEDEMKQILLAISERK